jgi:CubicO group peptidase (beta-lactamase class C family)
MSYQQLYDLASLAKTLVTAPLAIERLDLEKDRRDQLGLIAQQPITVRQLLSHTSGLPPWLPYDANVTLQSQLEQTEELRRQCLNNPLLRPGAPSATGVVYSDINYRCVCDLLEQETGAPLQDLAAHMYEDALLHHPWPAGEEAPVLQPDAIDKAAWILASELPVPARRRDLPHDCNARAGARGHAGFAASAPGLARALKVWLKTAAKQAREVGVNDEGVVYGLGLHRAPLRFSQILNQVPLTVAGVFVLVQGQGQEQTGGQADSNISARAPLSTAAGAAADAEWWMHTGFTGCLVACRVVASEADLCVGVLANRLPCPEEEGQPPRLLTLEELTVRRIDILTDWVVSLSTSS